jgi:hypothetical protein
MNDRARRSSGRDIASAYQPGKLLLHLHKIRDLILDYLELMCREPPCLHATSSFVECEQPGDLVQRKSKRLRPFDEANSLDRFDCVVPKSGSRLLG